MDAIQLLIIDLLPHIVRIILCIVLQICIKKTQKPGKLTLYIVINIICLVLYSVSLLRTLFSILVFSTATSSLFALSGLAGIIPTVLFIVWHICLIVSASKHKHKILKEENTIHVVYCNHCGTASPVGATFCKKCGKTLEQKANKA